MIRKFLSTLMAIALFTSALPVFAEGETEVTSVAEEAVTEVAAPSLSEVEESAVSLMRSLGVITKDDNIGSNMTRSQLAKAIYILQGMDNVSLDSATAFADITTDTDGLNQISYTYDMDFMMGDAGIWRPDDEVTFGELCAVIVRALGMEFIVGKYGSFPANYVVVADNYDILDNITIKTADKVPMYQAAVALENMLNVYFSPKSTNKFGIEGYYMTARLDVYKVEHARLTDNGITSLDGVSASSEGRVVIGGKIYETNGIDCTDLIGRDVNIYYRSGSGEARTLLSIFPIDNQKRVLLACENIKGYKNRTYTYKEGTKIRSYALTLNHSIIYNGKLVTDAALTQEQMCPDEGSVELISSKDNNSYDLVVIKDYRTFVVDGYIPEFRTLKAKNGQPELDLRKAVAKLDMLITDGETTVDVEERNIGHNDYVLSVARSLDDSVIEIYLCQETITGRISTIERTNKKLVVDDERYVVSKLLDDKWKTGYFVTMHLNQYGHIIWAVEAKEDTIKVGYIITNCSTAILICGGQSIWVQSRMQYCDL